MKPISAEHYDGRWTGPQGDVLVEVKRSSNARDVRDALIGLAFALDEEPSSSQAICLLGQTRLTHKRLNEEVQRFRRIVRPDLAGRISLTSQDERGNILGEFLNDCPELRAYLNKLARQELRSPTERVSREAVKAHLFQLWIKGMTPSSQAQIVRDTKASAPTVAEAIRDLEHQDLLQATRAGVMLKDPDWSAWRRMAEGYGAKRTTIRFGDPSGLARPPMELVKRLLNLQRQGRAASVALGGVVGAMHYYPGFDITAPPRLDLCVYDGDIEFMRQLDAGLSRTSDAKAKANVVVHLVQSDYASETTADGLRIASQLDCLADVLEIGLVAEAKDMTLHFNRVARATTPMAGHT